jgi:hypothetical protein
MHQKLADLHYKILKHPAYTPETPQGRKVFEHNESATLAEGGWFAALTN